jgi:hypothetical protein
MKPGLAAQPQEDQSHLGPSAVGHRGKPLVQGPAVLRRMLAGLAQGQGERVGLVEHGVADQLHQGLDDDLAVDAGLAGLRALLAPDGRGVWGRDGKDVDGYG